MENYPIGEWVAKQDIEFEKFNVKPGETFLVTDKLGNGELTVQKQGIEATRCNTTNVFLIGVAEPKEF